ncbi:hypothetical protein ELG77_08900 [Rhizobium leguminosarum]|uniref:hypothetical protein n=1 Tax=Rhizobium leguminosarum TaxID=384 RepID=UPI001031C239|nr:hypothetical protein [Rhizobium leguminosarum]TBG41879.1 hypothetical protein ELG77_08900 [Rhizobium leguminosarum]
MNSYTDESGVDGIVPAHPIECEGPTTPELAIDRTPQAKAQMLAGDILEQLDLSRGHMERTRIARMIEKFYPAQPDELAAEKARADNLAEALQLAVRTFPLTSDDPRKTKRYVHAHTIMQQALSRQSAAQRGEGR